jgi:hypothetical protein
VLAVIVLPHVKKYELIDLFEKLLKRLILYSLIVKYNII